MTTDIRLIDVGGATSYYLVNTTGVPGADVASGGALTAGSTTPLSILNDNWALRAPVPIDAYNGGPPFTNGGTLAYQSYGTTQQAIPLSIAASSHDNLADILRTLRRVLLLAAQWEGAALLYYQPSGASSAAYWRVISGYLIERTDPLNPAEGFYDYIEADLYLTLSPFGGRLSSGETLINAAAMKNTGTGSPDNVEAYGSGAGDMIYAGSPLNITLTVTSGNIKKLYLASIASRTYDASGAAALSASSGSGIVDTQVSQPNLAAVLNNQGLKCRVMMRFSAMTSNARIRVKAGISAITFIGPEIDPDNNATIVDMGEIPLDIMRQLDTTASLRIWISVRSSDGALATATLSYVETLLYYDWCVANGSAVTDKLRMRAFTEVSGQVCLPKNPGRFMTYSGTTPVNPWVAVGQPPRYFSGASLYLAWLNNSNLHTTSDALTATVTHAPLYFTMRGSG